MKEIEVLARFVEVKEDLRNKLYHDRIATFKVGDLRRKFEKIMNESDALKEIVEDDILLYPLILTILGDIEEEFFNDRI